MAPRSIWNGTIAFGEVTLPIKLFSAVQEHRIHFREVRLSDGCRIVHRRFGAESGLEVPAERIRRAYETSPGHQVVLADEEIAAAIGPNPKTIEIDHFVRTAQIDPIYYDRPYIVGAQDGSERAYRVLHAALQRTAKTGIGRFVLRSRAQLVALAPRGDALELCTMRFADELVRRAELEFPALPAAPSAKEIDMAERLIDAFAAPWEPARYEDRHREAVMAVIERKASGGAAVAPVARPARPAPDLLDALQQSLEQRRPRKPARRKPAPRKAPAQSATAKKAGKR